MGFNWSQQCCLKLSKEQGSPTDLSVGNEYSFKKKGYRLYSLETPIELITPDWKVVARVVITEVTAKQGLTSGKYRVLKVYSEEEKRVVSGTIIPYTEVR
jgi:hypothetical protein